MSHKWNVKTPRVAGMPPRQAHAGLPKGLWERELGRDGFQGAVTEFYHRNPPTAWSAIEDGLCPHLLDTANLSGLAISPWDAAELLANSDMRLSYWKTNVSMDHLVRNVDNDGLIFVHRGCVELFCDFGHISLVQGDYLAVPRGTMWRIETTAETEMLLIEAIDDDLSLAEQPSLGRHMPHDSGVLGIPEIDEPFRNQERFVETTVRIKRGDQITTMTYPFNPLDAEGWQGDLYPVRLNIADIRPIHSFRAHLVPSAYGTFVSNNFIVCTFVPYPSPTDPDALKLPSFHDNIDYDEVMFMHDGSKTHRIGAFRPGTLTFHPAGIPHGPHPAVLDKFWDPTPLPLESTYIMLDTRNPLHLGRDADTCLIGGYAMSWSASVNYAPDALKEK